MSDKLKQELFESVATGGKGPYTPNTELLKEFEKEDTVIAGFCINCGNYHEFAFPAAEEVFNALNQPLDFSGKYLQLHSCSICKGVDKKVSIQTF